MKPSGKYLSALMAPRIPGFAWQDPEDNSDRSLFRDILEYGCHIVSIKDSPKAPPFCFSIGFYLNLEHPEFFIMGLSSAAAGEVINRLFRLVEEGHRFSDGDRIDLFEEERAGVLKPFPKNLYFDYLGYACWFYRSLTFLPPSFGPKFPVFQIWWPDKEGRYPFEAGCHATVVSAQVPSPQLKKERDE